MIFRRKSQTLFARSRRSALAWRTENVWGNCVCASKHNNSWKGDRLPLEAGWKLLGKWPPLTAGKSGHRLKAGRFERLTNAWRSACS